MSKRLYIVVEGQSEEEFVKSMLAPFLQSHCIYAYPIIIRTSKGHKGGFVNYDHLKNDVLRLLKSQGDDVVVTTFIDFFRCPELPEQKSWIGITDHSERADEMQRAISRDICDHRFHPYIQLHEFEALLFSSEIGFIKYFEKSKALKIQEIITSYNNPEEINSSPEGAPSKRLLRIIPEYDKVMYGNIIALEIGLQAILDKCPRFNRWVNEIITFCR